MQIPGYTLIKKINSGGMATVFLATQHSVGRTVALKVMKPSLDKDPEFHQRFQREANIIGQLSHPNIIPIYDIGRHEGLNYISMEFLPGGSLDEKIRQGINPDQAISITGAMATALEHAHGKGYVHRDIKPENIIFRADDSPVLTDFGIARTIKSKSNMTQVGTVVGTPYYMSPEQAMGKPSDGRSDLYSLGVVLYEMLTGKKLFDAESPLAISVKHIHETPPRLPGTISALQPLLDQLLAKLPEQRFQTARELKVALDNITILPNTARTAGKNPLQQFSDFIHRLLPRNPKAIHTTEAIAVGQHHSDTQLATQISPTISAAMLTHTSENRTTYARFGIYGILLAGFATLGYSTFHKEERASTREQWASVLGQPTQLQINDNRELIALTVNPIPANARVRILNIRERYTPGMLLPAGTYQLEVSLNGYNTRKKWIRLTSENAAIDIALQKNNQPANHQTPKPELVLIPAGNFLMGNPATQNAIQTTINQDFYISRYEITFNEYDYFAVETNRALPDDNGWGRGERPVINVSWDDAIAYSNWLSKTTGQTFRLPSAAEWEYAARGNTTSAYWWGNNMEDARTRANCRVGCKSWWDSFFSNKTQIVGTFPPNDFGLHDTAGNVAEWTNDCADKFDASGVTPPVCLKRAVRGGAFTSKVANITAYSQIAVTASSSRRNIGFRVVQELPPTRLFQEQPNNQERPRRRNIFHELRDSILKRGNQ